MAVGNRQPSWPAPARRRPWPNGWRHGKLAGNALYGSVWLNKSGSFNDLDALRSANDRHRGQSDKQTVLHNPRDSGKRMRHCGRIVNPPKRRVDDPVAAIRDESMAVLAAPQIQRPRPPDRGDRLLDRLPGRGKPERRDLNRQRKGSK